MTRLTTGALVLASVVLLLLALLVGGWLLEPGEQQTSADSPIAVPSPSARVAEARPTARRSAPRSAAKPRPKRPRRASASRASATPTPTTELASTPTSPPRPRVTVPTRAAVVPTAAAVTSPAPVVPPPTQKEAEDVVRAYFAAIEADSYEAASALTVGQARTQTQEGAAEIQRQADAEGVTIDLRVPELAVKARPVDAAERPVAVDYLVQAWVDTFLGSVNARELPGSSVFRVARLPEGVRIVEIEGDLLPTAQS